MWLCRPDSRRPAPDNLIAFLLRHTPWAGLAACCLLAACGNNAAAPDEAPAPMEAPAPQAAAPAAETGAAYAEAATDEEATPLGAFKNISTSQRSDDHATPSISLGGATEDASTDGQDYARLEANLDRLIDAPADEKAALKAIVIAFQECLAQQNAAPVLPLLATNFSSIMGGRETFAEFVKKNDLRSLALNLDEAGFKNTGKEANIENFTLTGAPASLKLVIDFVKEDGTWKLAGFGEDPYAAQLGDVYNPTGATEPIFENQY